MCVDGKAVLREKLVPAFYNAGVVPVDVAHKEPCAYRVVGYGHAILREQCLVAFESQHGLLPSVGIFNFVAFKADGVVYIYALRRYDSFYVVGDRFDGCVFCELRHDCNAASVDGRLLYVRYGAFVERFFQFAVLYGR